MASATFIPKADEWRGFDDIHAVGSGPQTEVLNKLENLTSKWCKDRTKETKVRGSKNGLRS